MVRRSFLCLLPLGLIVFFGRPLDICSRPATDTGPSTVLAEDLEQEDMNPGTTPSGHTALFSWHYIALDLLVSGVSFSWWLWRRRGQEKHQSASDSPGTGCQGYDCCKELLQLLRENRALMRMCLRYRSLQRPGEKRPRKWGLWKRRRLYFSP